MSVLPEGYKEPDTSNYMKFEEGENIFRILSPVIVGMEYWVANKEGEGRIPVRKQMDEEILMEDLEVNPKTGELDTPKHFWACVVWNKNSERIQVLQISQQSIRKAITALERSKGWGDAREYDITVTKEGTGFDTEYTIMPNPKEEVSKKILEAYEKVNINLEALFSGDDPFKSSDSKDSKKSKELAEEIAKKI